MPRFDIRALLDDSLLESLDFPQLVPASLAAWRPLVVDGMKSFLERLPGRRLDAIFAGQFALPVETSAATRVVTLLSQCPTPRYLILCNLWLSKSLSW